MKQAAAAAIAAAAILIAAAPGSTGMSVAIFLAKAAALKTRGFTALFSSDYRLLNSEAKQATAAIDAEVAVRKAAGRPPLYCQRGARRMTPDEMIGALQRIPAAQRGMSVKDGFVRAIVARYPC